MAEREGGSLTHGLVRVSEETSDRWPLKAVDLDEVGLVAGPATSEIWDKERDPLTPRPQVYADDGSCGEADHPQHLTLDEVRITDLRAFRKWNRKVDFWRVQIRSYVTSREAALLLYTSLSGEAEAELEHTPLHRINAEDGIDYILQALKAPMEQKSVYQKRKFFAHFDQLNRYPSEGLRTYANRYRRVELSLEALGVNITGMYDVAQMTPVQLFSSWLWWMLGQEYVLQPIVAGAGVPDDYGSLPLESRYIVNDHWTPATSQVPVSGLYPEDLWVVLEYRRPTKKVYLLIEEPFTGENVARSVRMDALRSIVSEAHAPWLSPPDP
ncbi:hypothetical protein AK812_SmicGene1056 [Symbiodinium microadriaticum]|uniref:Uncharacterized protein n=1 Tax=Symbiodinium microadriaticum TaxID=2951 RepID=A0A1Q9F539_SYMMI|nr:hypothetical protein AK812_SmicGene1056 [Symbiodinium microadriaticum]